MEKSPYSTPESDVYVEPSVEVPADILKHIKSGWIAAVISGVVTLALVIYSLQNEAIQSVIDINSSVDVVLIFVLAFGIYKKSRTAATIMFLYFVISKVIMIVETGQFSGAFLSLVFLYFYFNAMKATYQYHQLISAKSLS